MAIVKNAEGGDKNTKAIPRPEMVFSLFRSLTGEDPAPLCASLKGRGSSTSGSQEGGNDHHRVSPTWTFTCLHGKEFCKKDLSLEGGIGLEKVWTFVVIHGHQLYSNLESPTQLCTFELTLMPPRTLRWGLPCVFIKKEQMPFHSELVVMVGGLETYRVIIWTRIPYSTAGRKAEMDAISAPLNHLLATRKQGNLQLIGKFMPM